MRQSAGGADALSYIKSNCILRSSADKIYYSKSKKKMSWILDLRTALLDGASLQDIARQFWDIYGSPTFQLAGIEMAGVPLVTALVMEAKARGYDTSALIVRIKRKKSMGNKIIEGAISGLPIVLVDDSLNSGRSAESARKKLEAEGLNVMGMFCLVDFRSSAGIAWRTKHRVEVMALYNLGEFGLTYYDTHAPNANYEVAWSFAAPRPKLDFAVAKSSPALFEDKVIFGTDCGTVWGVERLTGRIEWQFQTKDKTGKGVISSPIIHDGRLYFGAYDGVLYCLDPKTGREIWANHCCDWIGASPVIYNDRLFIGLEYRNAQWGGSVACFDLTGKLQWQKHTRIQQHGSPIVHEFDGKAYVITGTNDSDLLCLDPETGTVISSVKTGGPTKYHCAAWGNRAVACAFDAIYVWDFLTGEVLLRFETEDINYSRPLIVGNIAFCGSADENLYMIDMATAEIIGQLPVDEKIHSSPALIDGLVWFGTSAGELWGIDPINFEVIHRLAFPERLTCTPVSDGKLMFIHAYDNRMWAIWPKI
jgi:outer membrane protein assembly factor BamB/adenine/guanine phosphoribosyltransferase-like PRPP-binding protein